jgi:IS5 family transposase
VELGDDVVPDETTILRFRHLLERDQLTAAILAAIRDLLTEKRLLRKAGSAGPHRRHDVSAPPIVRTTATRCAVTCAELPWERPYHESLLSLSPSFRALPVTIAVLVGRLSLASGELLAWLLVAGPLGAQGMAQAARLPTWNEIWSGVGGSVGTRGASNRRHLAEEGWATLARLPGKRVSTSEFPR